MKFVWFLLAGLAFISEIHAQSASEKKDSLLAFLGTYSAEDSVRVNALIDLQEYYLVDDYEKGLPYIQEALTISKEIDYKTGKGFSLNALGAFYMKAGDNEKALEYTIQAIELFKSIGEDQNIYAAYNNLALLYKRLNKLEQAAATYLDMLQRLEGREETPSFVVVYYNLANTYQAMGEMDLYEEWLKKMLEVAQQLNFPLGIVEGKLGLAQIAVERNQFEYGVEMSTSLLPQLSAMALAQPEARAHKIAAAGYHGLKEYAKAYNQALESEVIYKKINDPTQLVDLLSLKTMILRDQNKFKKAFETSQEYHQLQDSLVSSERLQIIEELQAKYETARLERENDQAEIENLKLSQENRRNRTLLFGAFGILVAGVVAGIFYQRQQKLERATELKDVELKETQKRLSIEKQKREAELKAIRSQLNPHFLFNLMNTLQIQIVSGDALQANKTLRLVSDMMQKTLQHSRSESIRLQDELELVDLYLKAEKMRFQGELTITKNIDEEIEPEFIMIPPMLIQPYVENAVKHGLWNKQDGDRNLILSVSPKGEEHILIEIEDDGVGREKATAYKQRNPKKHNQFSTLANKERLQTIAKETGKEAYVQYVDLKKEGEAAGTKVELVYPILSN